MPAAITVPTVDIGPFFSAPFPGEDAFPSAVQTATAAQVDAVFRGDGFLFVRNFGLTEEQVHRMYSLSATLFKQPAHVKETQLAPLQRCTNTGYVGHGVERLNRARPNADMKEVSYSCHLPTFDYHANPAVSCACSDEWHTRRRSTSATPMM